MVKNYRSEVYSRKSRLLAYDGGWLLLSDHSAPSTADSKAAVQIIRVSFSERQRDSGAQALHRIGCAGSALFDVVKEVFAHEEDHEGYEDVPY